MKSLYIGKTASGREIWFPDVAPCLTAIAGDYSYLSWEGDVLGEQNIVRLYNTASLVKIEKSFGTWANRAILSYQYAQP